MPTLEQIQAKLKKLQAQAESLIAKRAHSVLNDIRKLMNAHGLTTADIDAHSSSAKKGPGRPAGSTTKLKNKQTVKAKSGKAAAKEKLPPKYRDPKTGATWSGWARPPLWIKDVKERSKFLINGRSESDADQANSTKPAGKKAAAKKVAAKKVARKNATVKTASTKALKAPVNKAAAKKVVAKKATAERMLAKKASASRKSAAGRNKTNTAGNQASGERAMIVSAAGEMPAI
jgi:DNA-binding protein H-NS